jgi:mRNA-degrading endonuclease RelE of RelBE toxin-antitoxin system
MYKIRFSKTTALTIKHLHPDLKKAAKAAVQELAENPYIGKEFQHELSGYYSHRFRRYRIVYKHDNREKIIDIYIVIHRKDVYELFSEYIKTNRK